MAVHGISGSGGIRVRPYRFREFVVQDETLSNRAPLVASLGLEYVDLMLRADVLRHRRVRLSYCSHRVFIEDAKLRRVDSGKPAAPNSGRIGPHRNWATLIPEGGRYSTASLVNATGLMESPRRGPIWDKATAGFLAQ
jgi:hypothetical protein